MLHNILLHHLRCRSCPVPQRLLTNRATGCSPVQYLLRMPYGWCPLSPGAAHVLDESPAFVYNHPPRRTQRHGRVREPWDARTHGVYASHLSRVEQLVSPTHAASSNTREDLAAQPVRERAAAMQMDGSVSDPGTDPRGDPAGSGRTGSTPGQRHQRLCLGL